MVKYYKADNDGNNTEMVGEELENYLADNAKVQKSLDAIIQEEEDAETGNKKFLDMGLTQAEVTAMTKYIPRKVRYDNYIAKGYTEEKASELSGYNPGESE